MEDQEEPHGIYKLSTELLRDILDHVEADPERFVQIDRRAYLSVESFKPPSPAVPSQAQDVGNFRLVCRKFAELGIPHQFTRIATRFSRAGFKRLDDISRSPHLAKHTKKFSYMIPFFYVEGRDHIAELSRNANLSQQDIEHLIGKGRDQKLLVQSGDDVASLRRAMKAFKSLQHVQILRLQDRQDNALLEFIYDHQEATQLVDLRWTPACIHAVRTMGDALLHAQSPFNRFSGPMMSPQSALELKDTPPISISSLAERLTCLELHFDAGLDLNEQMRELSGLFRTVFTAAKNMQAVHIGFPSRSPLELNLEEVFHNVRWDKLRAFGIQAWRLDAEEIIRIARRHRKTLRGLRLRDVLLKEGSKWKDVLHMLRSEMDILEWVSLRRIDYASHFDNLWASGVELTDADLMLSSESDLSDDFAPGHISEGEDEVEEEEEEDDDDDEEKEGEADEGNSSSVEADSEEDDDEQDDDNGPGANELALSPDTPASAPWSFSSRGSHLPKTADELGDNGGDVLYEQRKFWEHWVVAKPRA